jgi:hypothetical protein
MTTFAEANPDIDPFELGAILEISSYAEFAEIEDLVAEHITPNASWESRRQWGMRPHIKGELRPSGLNRVPTDMELRVMINPHEHLETARHRGFAFQTTNTTARVRRIVESMQEDDKAIGFAYTALARNFGQKVVGQIQAEAWYYPGGNSGLAGYTPARRILTKPRLEKENFIEYEEESTRIAWSLVRGGVLRAAGIAAFEDRR